MVGVPALDGVLDTVEYVLAPDSGLGIVGSVMDVLDLGCEQGVSHRVPWSDSRLLGSVEQRMQVAGMSVCCQILA